MKWRLIHGLDKGARMNKRRDLIIALGASALVGPLDSFAQQQGKLWRVGVLDTTSTNATTTIPIVLAAVGDPVESGLVKSLSHPGGNVTGLSSVTANLTAKRVELI